MQHTKGYITDKPSEKRRHSRYRCRMPIRFKLNKSVSTCGIGQLLDIGKGGARLFAPGSFRPGDRLQLRFGGKPVEHIQAEARVIWTGKAGMGTCGVYFAGLEQQQWDQLQRIVKE